MGKPINSSTTTTSQVRIYFPTPDAHLSTSQGSRDMHTGKCLLDNISSTLPWHIKKVYYFQA